jgi:glycosyltransferase involved in cell wall biosynthesis
MKVCYFGTYREEYNRNILMMEGLRQRGIEVVEIHEQLWQGIEDRVQAASGGWMRLQFWGRVLKVYSRLLLKYRRGGAYDVLVIGYPGQFDVFLGWVLARLRRKPLVWDIFMSIYLISVERGLDQRSPRTIELIKWVEKRALQLPQRLIQDTAQYVQWFGETYGIEPDRFRLVPTGADHRVFQPAAKEAPPSKTFRVTYYGTYIPNHGVLTIVAAARLLKEHPDIQFEMIGSGPELPAARQMAQNEKLENVTFIEWLDQAALAERAASTDLHLGVFGTTPQSMMTIQNKIYEGMAMRLPVLSGDSAAVRAEFTHRKHCYLVERANPEALAAAILALKTIPRFAGSSRRMDTDYSGKSSRSKSSDGVSRATWQSWFKNPDGPLIEGLRNRCASYCSLPRI